MRVSPDRRTLTDATRGLELDADDQVPAVRLRDRSTDKDLTPIAA
jgi:hypothetical protein